MGRGYEDGKRKRLEVVDVNAKEEPGMGDSDCMQKGVKGERGGVGADGTWLFWPKASLTTCERLSSSPCALQRDQLVCTSTSELQSAPSVVFREAAKARHL
jgi:hypothetical protein